jgi:hypothetical protein
MGCRPFGRGSGMNYYRLVTKRLDRDRQNRISGKNSNRISICSDQSADDCLRLPNVDQVQDLRLCFSSPCINLEVSMKFRSVFAFVFLTLTSATACLAQAIEKRACNVDVDVTDTDPKGTNVRAERGGHHGAEEFHQ